MDGKKRIQAMTATHRSYYQITQAITSQDKPSRLMLIVLILLFATFSAYAITDLNKQGKVI